MKRFVFLVYTLLVEWLDTTGCLVMLSLEDIALLLMLEEIKLGLVATYFTITELNLLTILIFLTFTINKQQF